MKLNFFLKDSRRKETRNNYSRHGEILDKRQKKAYNEMNIRKKSIQTGMLK